MKTRLVKNKDNSLMLLLDNGKLLYVEKHKLANYFFHHKTLLRNNPNHLNFEIVGRWDNEFEDISEYPGDTVAFTSNKGHLVIVEITPFAEVLSVKSANASDEELFITVKEYSEKYKKSVEQVKVFCRKGRIKGAKKIGRDWMIPKDAIYPIDRRIKAGATINSEMKL